jgi:ligand-binding sensor domain-containing protein
MSGSNVYAATQNGVYLYTNNDSTWTNISPDQWVSVHGATSILLIGNQIMAGTNYNGVYMTDDNGSSWNVYGGGLTYDANIVYLLTMNGNRIFAGTKDGVYTYNEAGFYWSKLNSYVTESIVFIGDSMFAGTTSNGVMISNNNGTTWNSANDGLTSAYVHSLTSAGNYLFAGTDVGIFLSADNGNKWTNVTSGLPNSIVNSLIINGNFIYAGTSGFGLWKRPLSEMGIINSINININCGIIIYPNPVKDKLIVDFNGSFRDYNHLSLFNMAGQELMVQQIQDQKTQIDISCLPAGVYYIKAGNGKDFKIEKIIKE